MTFPLPDLNKNDTIVKTCGLREYRFHSTVKQYYIKLEDDQFSLQTDKLTDEGEHFDEHFLTVVRKDRDDDEDQE